MTVVRPELCSRRLARRHSGKNKIGHGQTLVLPEEKKPLIIRGRGIKFLYKRSIRRW